MNKQNDSNRGTTEYVSIAPRDNDRRIAENVAGKIFSEVTSISTDNYWLAIKVAIATVKEMEDQGVVNYTGTMNSHNQNL
tara:strand:- start:9 stop:248 length:240 start_codon:yes stop_codon:yes gene_type:complete